MMISRLALIAVLVGLAAGSVFNSPINQIAWKNQSCARFMSLSVCDEKSWVGLFRDIFSPDDQGCPHSLRYIDFNYETKQLQVSASGTGSDCKQTWGRRFNHTTPVNPIVAVSPRDQCQGEISFLSKVPKDAPVRPFAELGALNFTLSLGCNGTQTCEGPTQVIRWNGMYNGKGGPWLDGKGAVVQVPPSKCDNFWAPLREVQS